MKAADPPHIVTPDVEVHRKIGNFPEGAFYAARGQLGIGSAFDNKPADVGAVQKAVQNLTAAVQYSYNDTYHGMHHDRGVLPSNMDDPHFALDFSTGGAAYSALTREQVIEQTQNARRITSGAAQDLGEDFLAALKKASTLIVHTADAVENVAVDTASKASKGLSQAVSAVGEDLVHGDLIKAGADLFTGGENLGKTLTIGATTALADAVKGAEQVLVVTLKLGKEAIQAVIHETAAISKAINSILDKIGIVAGKFIAWMLDKVGWGDVLHAQPVLLDSLNTRLDQGLAFFKDVKNKADNFFNQQSKALDAAIDNALSVFGVEKVVSQQPSPPVQLSGAIEQVEWLIAKFTQQSQGSPLTMPDLSLIAGLAQNPVAGPAQNPLSDLVSTIESKVGADGGTIIAALGDAYEHLKRMFNDSGSTPQELLGVVLEVARAAAHIGLDIVSAVVDAILDIVILAIPQFKTIGNAELDVPFVSAFYQGLSDGRKLSPFGLAALLLAIPLTILYRALEGKRPFDHVGAAQQQGGAGATTAGDDPTWNYVYAVCHLVLSISATINDVWTFRNDQKTRRPKNNSIPMRPINQIGAGQEAGGMRDFPEERPMPSAGEVEAGPDAGGFRDFRGESPMPSVGQVEARSNAGFRDAFDEIGAGEDAGGFQDTIAEEKMAPFNSPQTLLGAFNLGVSILSTAAGSPIPPDSDHDIPDYSSVKDVFEGPNYFSHVAFVYGCACIALDVVVFTYTAVNTYQQSITEAALAKGQSYIGLFNCLRGLAHFSLMITLHVFDEQKYYDFQAKMNDPADPTFASTVTADPIPDPVGVLGDLQTYVKLNYKSQQFGGPVTDSTTAQNYLGNLVRFYNWACGYGTNPVILGISEKTFGNCMDAFPEIGQIGTFKPLIDLTEGISLLGTAACDGIANLAEGVTYAVRTNRGRLY